MGPLEGIRVIEIAGIGPGPFAAMLLADLGARVLRVDRVGKSDIGISRPDHFNPLLRSRQRVAIDLKSPAGMEKLFKLVDSADGLIEGFRPGVAERLGFGPDVCLKRNPDLVYGRITGWGQTGPLAQAGGHDLNYIALTGALNAIGRAGQPPSIPLALVGDFGGGALYLTMGMLAAMLSVARGGKGQVIDSAMVDGAASLATTFFGLKAAGMWNNQRGSNILDSGAPFYDVYECADGKWVSISTIEPKFFKVLVEKLGLDPATVDQQYDREKWPELRKLLAKTFKSGTQEEWNELLQGTDACYAPVLSFDEAPSHPHVKERGVLIEVDGIVQPAPAPRFGGTPLAYPTPPQAEVTEDFDQAYAYWMSEDAASVES